MSNATPQHAPAYPVAVNSSVRNALDALKKQPAWSRWACAALLLLIVALGVFRHPLADALWPDTRIQQLLLQADAALNKGKLSSDDGNGARQLYEAAQALDGDRNEARAGLAKVAQAAVAQGEAALRADDFGNARAGLQLARDLQAPSAGVDALANALRQRQIANAGLGDLLQRAQAAQRAGHLDDGDDAALPLYARILAVQANATAALEGREDALADLLKQARDELQRGQLEQGAALVERARRYDAGHVDLPDSQAALSRAMEAKSRSADALFKRGRYLAAHAAYQSVLAVSSADSREHAAAQAGLDNCEARLAAHVPPANAPKLSAAQRRQRVRKLLDGIDAAAQRGDWLTPPADSVYDRIHAAQAIAADDAQLLQAQKQLRPQAKTCFENELAANRLHRARACFDVWNAVAANDAALPGARKRLAARWLAVGSEQLGLGNMAVAKEALAQARELDAAAPGLAVFARRVREAGAAKP